MTLIYSLRGIDTAVLVIFVASLFATSLLFGVLEAALSREKSIESSAADYVPMLTVSIYAAFATLTFIVFDNEAVWKILEDGVLFLRTTETVVHPEIPILISLSALVIAMINAITFTVSFFATKAIAHSLATFTEDDL